MSQLDLIRETINSIDAQMAQLFQKRMEMSAQAAAFKKDRGLPIRDEARERALIERSRGYIADPVVGGYYEQLLHSVLALSRAYQSRLLNGTKAAYSGAESDCGYPILLAPGALAHAGEHLSLDRRVLLVTDSGVPEEYVQAVARSCRQAHICTLPAGERSKSFDNYRLLLREMLRLGMDRGDCVAAVGGGMVGDLAGFAAATYMRGIDFYHVPTTLLAQVDASIGGKTAIDMDGVKNPVGAFHQPRAVLIDTDTLRSLPRRQIAAGLAESVKMATTCDAALFALMESSADLTGILPEIIARSLRIKADIVARDPTEQGLRRVLNFGHTIGHAIESCANGTLLHGECVALGMLPMCAPALRPRLAAILRKCGLPVTGAYTAGQLLPYLRHDKKTASGSVTVVLVDKPGAFRMEQETPEDILRRWEEMDL